jgi:signal peptidase I
MTSTQQMGAELVTDLLARFGSAAIRVQGTSMLPALCPGDQVLIQSCNSNETEVGDVVAFRREGRLFVHRVVERFRDGHLLTRGDAISLQDDPVSTNEFLGKITQIERRGRVLPMCGSLLQRIAAAIFRRSRPCSSLFQKLASL